MPADRTDCPHILQNVPVLPLKLDDFCARVKKGKVPLTKKNPQPGIEPERVPANPQLGMQYQRLRAVDGPRLAVDEDGKFIAFYAPNFWGNETQVRRD
jgi:hypothetical protein